MKMNQVVSPVRPRALAWLSVAWLASIAVVASGPDGDWAWVSALAMFGVFVLGMIVLHSALHYATLPLRRWTILSSPDITPTLDAIGAAITALVKMAVALAVAAFVIGGIIGLLLIGIRAL